MTKTAIVSAFFALSASISFAEPHGHHDDDHHDDHHSGHHEDPNSLAHQTQTRESLQKRLHIAPIHYGCEIIVHALEDATRSASTVRMLGKVEYDFGKSWLGDNSKHGIENVILRSRTEHGENTLIVVLGYADRTGRSQKNYELSDTRAANVRKHIDHVNWEHNLGMRVTSIPMGEEVELCAQDLGHNRVAEIWLIEFPKPVSNFYQESPVTLHHGTEERFTAAPVRRIIRTTEPAPAPTPVVETHVEETHIEEMVTSVQTAPEIEEPAPEPAIAPPPIEVIKAEGTKKPAQSSSLSKLAEYLENNVMLAPNADPAEFARQLSILKELGE